MHSRTESGFPLDWHDVLRIHRAKIAESTRLRNLAHVNEALKQLDRQPTPEEIAAAAAVLKTDPAGEPQAELNLKARETK